MTERIREPFGIGARPMLVFRANGDSVNGGTSMARGILLALAVGLLAVCGLAQAADDKTAAAKEALQKFNEFVGQWNGDAQAEKPSGLKNWKESHEWGWKFKGDDVWIIFTVKDGSFIKKGEVRYQEGKMPYKMTVTTADDKELVFEGKLDKKRLAFSRTADNGDTQELTMFIAGGGVYLNYEYYVKTKGTTVAKKYFVVQAKKEGESLAGGGKKPECIVSGGLGTMQVTFGGKTYYVCCSGCRDAFNDNPKKYVDALGK